MKLLTAFCFCFHFLQLGFLDMGIDNQLGLDQNDDSGDDDDLEAELAALTVGITKKPKRGHLQ